MLPGVSGKGFPETTGRGGSLGSLPSALNCFRTRVPDFPLSAFRFLLCAAALLLLSTGGLFAQTTNYIPWNSYHKDAQRSGQNKNSTVITDPGNLNLIWVFPRATVSYTADSSGAVNNNDWMLPVGGSWSWGGSDLASLESVSTQLAFAVATSNQNTDTAGSPIPAFLVQWSFSQPV